MMDDVTIRLARSEESTEAIALLDEAMLEFDRGRVRTGIQDDEVLVAVRRGRIVGVVAVSAGCIIAIAVRPTDRGRGIGGRLLDAAAERCDCLRASFDATLRGFYVSNGFTIEDGAAGRLRGRRSDP